MPPELRSLMSDLGLNDLKLVWVKNPEGTAAFYLGLSPDGSRITARTNVDFVMRSMTNAMKIARIVWLRMFRKT